MPLGCKERAEFYPQGVCGIRMEAKLPTAAQSPQEETELSGLCEDDGRLEGREKRNRRWRPGIFLGLKAVEFFDTTTRARGRVCPRTRVHARTCAREGTMRLYPLQDKGYRRFFALKKLTVRRMVTLLYWY